jgi:hypothetical protein
MERLRDPAAKPGNASRRLLRHLRRQVHRPALGRALLRSGLPPGCLPRAARAVEGVDGASRAVAGAEAAAQARRRGPARAEEAREARRCGQQSGPGDLQPDRVSGDEGNEEDEEAGGEDRCRGHGKDKDKGKNEGKAKGQYKG